MKFAFLALLGAQAVACVDEPAGAYAEEAVEQASIGVLASPITFSVPGRKDLVHDAKRGRLYITTGGAGGQVLSYNMVTLQFEAPLLAGGSFVGIDLSPDEDRLVVADATTDATQNWIWRIDLVTGAAQKTAFTRAFGEAGTFTAAFTSNTEVLVTSEYSGSGWVPMRRVDLSTSAAQTIRSVRQATMLAPSANLAAVAYAESNISSGAWGRYDVAGQTFATSSTGWFVYEIAASRTASQLVVPTYSGMFVYDGALVYQAKLGTYAQQVPVGAVYNPLLDELYLAWYGSATSLDVYSSVTLQKLRNLAPVPGLFSWNGNRAFVNGRMRVSRDGKLVLTTTGTSGVGIYPTGT